MSSDIITYTILSIMFLLTCHQMYIEMSIYNYYYINLHLSCLYVGNGNRVLLKLTFWRTGLEWCLISSFRFSEQSFTVQLFNNRLATSCPQCQRITSTTTDVQVNYKKCTPRILNRDMSTDRHAPVIACFVHHLQWNPSYPSTVLLSDTQYCYIGNIFYVEWF